MPLDLQALVTAGLTAEVMKLLGSGERLFAVDEARLLGFSARSDAGRPEAPRSVAVMKLHGALYPRGSGSMESFAERLAATAANADVGAIVLDVNSPGGTVARTAETAAAVRAAAQVKPVVALADNLMASAAYWIGSQASKLWVTPSGEVGSIGVRGSHFDISQALADAGVKVTSITSSDSPYKGELSPFAPLSEEALAEVQAQADREHGHFLADVARGRRTSVDAVRDSFGRGRTVDAQRAVQLGMADQVGTLADVLASLRTLSVALRKRSALAFA